MIGFKGFNPSRAVLRSGAAVLLIATLPAFAGVAIGQQQPQSMEKASEEEIQQFCTSIADAARDQRYLLQKQELDKLQADVDSRIAVLETRRAEYEDWLTRRNDFMKKADAQLVEIYRKMAPDAAAPQLAETDVVLAAAIIMKLPPRQSSLILTEMKPDKAAAVAQIMSSAGDANTSKDPS
ncbi:MotE family protein [Rhizobium glycinendophyticum]|uniref:Flagellar protein n=1 Tax=Rhizobium glycinendophyticum TaxID=2589807 RepID=A0A504U952_9HYPH|nr:MotE family protein [Rhizobium glycinendophyticum]TPP09840.1 flagellar protein [Rhizobium glycinendophyticum]